MKRFCPKREIIATGMILILFAAVSFTSLSSIQTLQGNARVVNYVGLVRGASQKLVKEELIGWYLTQENPTHRELDWYPDDSLLLWLDTIVEELMTGEGPNNLTVLPDEQYLSDMLQVQEYWRILKEQLNQVRGGAPPLILLDSSQRYFELVNAAAFSAEAYSEAQVSHILRILIGANGAFAFCLIVSGLLYIRNQAVMRRADALGRIAFVDPLTQINNRASCDAYLRQLHERPPAKDLVVVIFDMNNLKQTNDMLGHQFGDRIITDFGQLLKEAADGKGFVGRIGGDEFIAVFEDGSSAVADGFLQTLQKEVFGYNIMKSKLEQIDYAVGYVIENANRVDIEDIIHQADNNMYINKRKRKQLNRLIGGVYSLDPVGEDLEADEPVIR